MNELDTAELAPLATAPEDAAGAAPNGERQSWAEKELLRLNRALRVLSACNRAVTASRHEAELLQEVCRIVLEVGGYSAVWVSYAEQERRTREYFIQWGASYQLAAGSPPDERGKFIAKCRQALDSIKRMVRNNPNFALLVFNAINEKQWKDWCDEREEELRRLTRR